MVLGADGFFAPSVGSFQVPVTPPDSDPDEGDQVTVCFAEAWLPFVLGALQQLTLQATWEGDTDAILLAQSRAQLLLAIIGGEVGGCLESVCFTDVFYDSDCDCIKQFPPGGGDAIENPAADPRHNPAFQFPPIVDDDPQCKAANNMVAFIHALMDDILLVVDATSEASGLIAFIMPYLLELGPFGVFLDIILELASLLLGAGGTALTAAFTTGMYDQLACIFFCNIQADGSVTAENLVTIETKIASDIGGLAQTILDAMLLIMGEVGLSNAGTKGDAAADCSGCGCEWCYEFDFTLSDGGWTEFTDGTPGATYVPGVGWTQKTSGPTTGTYIQSPLLDPTVFTHIEFDYDAEFVATNTVDYGQLSTAFPMVDVCTAAGGFHTVSWDGSVTFDRVGLQVGNSVTGGGGTSVIPRARYRGTGPNPFGTDNC